MFGVLFVELQDFAGVAVEEVQQLTLVAFVDGPIDLVAGAEGAAVAVGEFVGDGEGGSVGVPGEAGERETEIVFGMGDDVEIGGDVAREAKDRVAVAREGIAGLVGDEAIEVELNGLTGLLALAVVISKFPNDLQRAAAFVVG